MRHLLASSLVLLVSLLTLPASSIAALAQSVEVDDSGTTAAPVGGSTGKEKANEYFKGRKTPPKAADADATASAAAMASKPGATPRFMAIHIGTFFSAQTYRWDTNDRNYSPGGLNAGVTYRLGEWVNAADFSIRIEYTSYALDAGSAKKLSISPLLTFPDANSRFPIYFGAGLGPGLFLQQVPDKSPLALDWQLFGGVRVLDVYQHIGFMVEAGLKNHVLLLSPGQFNGVFLNVGTVFAF